MEQFFENLKLLKVPEDEIVNQKSPIIITWTEFILKIYPEKKNL